MHFLDSYSIRARLAPAIISIASVSALIVASVPWREFDFPQAVAIGFISILAIGASDFARRAGKFRESRILKANAGRPMATTLRHRDPMIDPVLKARYLKWLGDCLGEVAPTEAEEKSDKLAADRFYDRCSVLLRDKTRDRERFGLVYEENVTYGFRRNLFGLKYPALVTDLIVILVCLWRLWPELELGTSHPGSTIYLFLIAFTSIHALYFVFWVTKLSVLQAADQYGRQLVLSAESLIPLTSPPPTAPPRP